jgi:hypothetical protein
VSESLFIKWSYKGSLVCLRSTHFGSFPNKCLLVLPCSHYYNVSNLWQLAMIYGYIINYVFAFLAIYRANRYWQWCILQNFFITFYSRYMLSYHESNSFGIIVNDIYKFPRHFVIVTSILEYQFRIYMLFQFSWKLGFYIL